MRGLADAGGRGFRFGQLDAQRVASSLPTSARRAAAAASCSRVSARRARADSITSASAAVAAREEHLLPAPHLVAQPRVAPRLGRLPLERAALLLDLEDDVVDAREVLLRRFELELGGAAARLVFGDARGFFDQLAPIGRAAS